MSAPTDCELDYERLSAIAETFPSLRGAPGVRPFDAMTLSDWNAPKPAELVVDFILWLCPEDYHLGEAVWSRQEFNVLDAARWMGKPDRDALAAWIADPWMPSLRRQEREVEIVVEAEKLKTEAGRVAKDVVHHHRIFGQTQGGRS